MYSKWILDKRVALLRLYILVESKEMTAMQTCSVALGLTAITNELFGLNMKKFGPEIVL